MNKCHECHLLEIFKQGFHGNKQRFKCRGCGHQSIRANAPMSDVEREKRMLCGLCLFLSSLSKNAEAKLMGVSCQSVCNWILKMGDPDKLLLNAVAIEQNNGRQRHWLAAFRRRSIVISKSLKVLKATLAPFAC